MRHCRMKMKKILEYHLLTLWAYTDKFKVDFLFEPNTFSMESYLKVL